MDWFDWFALILVVGLAIRGYKRGLIVQLSAFIAVGLGVLGGLYLRSSALPLLPELGHPVLELVVSFTLVFAAIALSINFLARALKSAVDALFLGTVDRGLGALLGILLGVQVLLVAVLMGSRYLPEGTAWLESSRSAPMVFRILDTIMPLLPEHFGEFFDTHVEKLLRQGEELLEGVGAGKELRGELLDQVNSMGEV
ncbi:MAG: CvpA family protein [Candidatus Latescibacterota bacterium]|nr:CvpA family protein [Candidatus Latescibacterota bacterium]